MAETKTEEAGVAAKKTGRKATKATRTRTRTAAQRDVTPRADMQTRTRSAAADPDQMLVAYAMGELSLDELAQRKPGTPAAQAMQGMQDLSMGQDMMGGDMAEPEAPARGRRAARRQAQAGNAILRLREARERGVLSRGELDRAADLVTAEAPEAAAPAQVNIKTPRQPQAEAIVRRHVLYTTGAGLLSFGFVDLLVVPGLQLKMLQNLCQLYGVRFTEEWGKNLIGALLGTATAKSLAIRGVPLIGVFAAPATNAAATWALGKVFTQHFESGGTLLSFVPGKLKSYFADYFNSAPPLVATTK